MSNAYGLVRQIGPWRSTANDRRSAASFQRPNKSIIRPYTVRAPGLPGNYDPFKGWHVVSKKIGPIPKQAKRRAYGRGNNPVRLQTFDGDEQPDFPNGEEPDRGLTAPIKVQNMDDVKMEPVVSPAHFFVKDDRDFASAFGAINQNLALIKKELDHSGARHDHTASMHQLLYNHIQNVQNENAKMMHDLHEKSVENMNAAFRSSHERLSIDSAHYANAISDRLNARLGADRAIHDANEAIIRQRIMAAEHANMSSALAAREEGGRLADTLENLQKALTTNDERARQNEQYQREYYTALHAEFERRLKEYLEERIKKRGVEDDAESRANLRGIADKKWEARYGALEDGGMSSREHERRDMVAKGIKVDDPMDDVRDHKEIERIFADAERFVGPNRLDVETEEGALKRRGTHRREKRFPRPSGDMDSTLKDYMREAEALKTVLERKTGKGREREEKGKGKRK